MKVDEVVAVDKPLLVGESNPYGSDPTFALYPAPEWSAGHRLCTKILGLGRKEYLERFDRVNLCTGPWRIREARARARAIMRERGRPAVVLLGARVCDAVGINFEPFTSFLHRPATNVVILPHPSGRCRLWCGEGAILRARGLLRDAGVLGAAAPAANAPAGGGA